MPRLAYPGDSPAFSTPRIMNNEDTAPAPSSVLSCSLEMPPCE